MAAAGFVRGVIRLARGFVAKVVILSILAAPIGAQKSFPMKMRDINEDFDRQLDEIMASEAAVTYSTINTTGTAYAASTKFNPKGMGQLYNVTNMFIDLIQSKQAYPEGMITLEDGQPKFADPVKEWKIILKHYSGVAGLAIAGLLLAAILPCIGLFFCCCRCAGHCGGRSQPFDKKHDHCRKIMLSIVLIAVATIILFGVVCAFVTNEYMQEGTNELPNNLKTNLKDVQLYLRVTSREIDNLLGTNYNQLEYTLNNILQASGRIVTEQLAKYSDAASLTNLNNIVSGLGEIGNDLKMIKDITQGLRTNATQLEIELRQVKNSLLYTLKECTIQYCQEIRNEYNVNGMAVQVHFDKLPDVSHALHNITLLMEGNIVSEVSQGRDSFAKIQKDIQHAVNQTIPVISASIRRAGDSLQGIANNITSLLDKISSDIHTKYIRHVDIAGTHINQYSQYRYYVGLGISGILLTVLCCLTLGLLCGVCGKRPDGYGDDCCNKGAGARFLMMAVWIIFLLTSILMIVTVAHMVTGVIIQRGVCEPLKNPKDNRMFNLVDDFVQIKSKLYPNKPDVNINMSYIITMCHANETLYKVLKLENLIDLTSLHTYTERYDINNTIQQLRKKINLSPGVVILSDSARSKLNDLAQSGLSEIMFSRYTDLLENNITNLNLEHLANKLRDVAAKLPEGHDGIKRNLETNAINLERCHRTLVTPMTLLSQQLSVNALTLQEHIKFNHSSMTEAIHDLVNETTEAQKLLNKEGPKYVQYVAKKFGDKFLSLVDDFMNFVATNGMETVGKCAPVSNAYDATLVASCNKILDPFNGFWASVGWCLVLFIPTIILCAKLSALYQKSDPYPGPLVEAEYLYDAYADRDNIPLAHVHDKKHGAHSRHHPAPYVESYDGPAVAYSDRERVSDAHQSSSNHDSRYADLAPKNWDFPNGGPPRYQPAAAAPPLSTEYERPPPYYYPGPGDRN
ncbi:prominin-like protein isoform X2 [Neodiprion pinetum]|uniref:Prominin-like protein isoform X3 n=1 Tax=Neodiprion lecontei TaxID=441921 RepID=A0A6J0BHM1_NEOLC|nr:prominin-like protein isoform X3 [Neodiprion lecontei]XP_046418813.1 prominin-like protein isoform X3 [Neodiprion fabricii]XP_046473727.1 prominin-like protein isoform X3 [Neodiprion pinetum]XP_046610995.1 prominin-like protein isoform X3 [Neodiprion virginianus]